MLTLDVHLLPTQSHFQRIYVNWYSSVSVEEIDYNTYLQERCCIRSGKLQGSIVNERSLQTDGTNHCR